MNANTVKLIFQRNLPEIMEGVGIAFGILATIKACEATLHVEEELDRIQRHTEAIKEVPEEEGINTKKELTKAYIKGAGRIARLYAPAVALGAASIGSVLYGHHIIKKENIALAALAESLDKTHKAYRKKVADKIGEEAERELCHNLSREDVEYIEETEDGKEKKKSKKNAPVVGDDLGSPYARKFDDKCINWKRSPERNLYFLRMMQSEANDMLHSRGYLFLNEVYDLLGFPITKDGQLVGWIRGGNDVDFGIYTVFGRENNDFTNGYSPVALLDFNVDGVIYNKF